MGCGRVPVDLRSRSNAGRRLSPKAEWVTTSMMDFRDQKVEGGSLNIAAAFSGEVECTGRLVNAVILMCGFLSFDAYGVHSRKSIRIIPPSTHDRPNCQRHLKITPIIKKVGTSVWTFREGVWGALKTAYFVQRNCFLIGRVDERVEICTLALDSWSIKEE